MLSSAGHSSRADALIRASGAEFEWCVLVRERELHVSLAPRGLSIRCLCTESNKHTKQASEPWPRRALVLNVPVVDAASAESHGAMLT